MMLFVYAIPEANTKITILKLYQKQINNNFQYFANFLQKNSIFFPIKKSCSIYKVINKYHFEIFP